MMKRLIALFVVLCTMCFAGIDPWTIKNESELQGLDKYQESIGRRMIAFRANPPKTYAEFKAVSESFDNIYRINPGRILGYAQTIIPSLKAFVPEMLADESVPALEKMIVARAIKMNEQKFLELLPAALKSQYISVANAEVWVNMIMDFDTVKTEDKIAALKKIRMKFYPRIGEDEKTKQLVVKVELMIKALKED